MTSPLATARRIVVKTGSALVVGPDGAPDAAFLAGLAGDCAGLRARGVEIAIVASGAVALGRRAIGLSGALKLQEKQALAAIGQPRLMRAFEAAFAGRDLVVAQALVTPEDTERRRRWLNGRATLETLLALGAVPVINENDTVATAELRYGDNDRLAARVAQMISAEALVLLSDVDGLYERDPRSDPGAPFLPLVEQITPEIEAMAGGANAGAGVGSGGMRTKIAAAKIAVAAGCATAIARGAPDALARLFAGGRCTWFLPSGEPRAAYKAWIAGRLDAKGALIVDAGAAAALAGGKSLLPAGVTAVIGPFEKGDAVRVLDAGGAEIGRGIVRYDAGDCERIKGLRLDTVEAALGWSAGPLVHADDLALA